jgi:hypothetical protein
MGCALTNLLPQLKAYSGNVTAICWKEAARHQLLQFGNEIIVSAIG